VSGIRFEWDEAKNLSNQRKHGVNFQLASQVFRDLSRVLVADGEVDGEQRWQTIGQVRRASGGVLLLLVAHTVREEVELRVFVAVVRIISARKATRGRGEVMPTKMVSYTLETLPELTEADLASLEALAARPDSEIDFSDAHELTAEQWKKEIRGSFYRPVKRQITARVDADVLAWLKSQGKGYQSRINAILRREMLTALKAAATK
jgi:uncharacterized DUF497 family protein/uncharacterized protein (DUF4415 family)